MCGGGGRVYMVIVVNSGSRVLECPAPVIIPDAEESQGCENGYIKKNT